MEDPPDILAELVLVHWADLVARHAGGRREPFDRRHGPGRELLRRGAGRDHDQGRAVEGRGEPGEEIQGGVIGEVEVVEREEQGPVRGELEEELGQLGIERRAVRVDPFRRTGEEPQEPVGLLRVVSRFPGRIAGAVVLPVVGGREQRDPRAERRGGVSLPPVALRRPQEVLDQRERSRDVGGEGTGAEDQVAEPFGGPGKRTQDRGLADAARTNEEQDAPGSAIGRGVEALQDQVGGLVPAEKRDRWFGPDRGRGAQHMVKEAGSE